MNICKWCNIKVTDENTVWYRRNLVLGYSFCSTKCATKWKESNHNTKNNESISTSSKYEDLAYESEQRNLLQEKNDKESIEIARKTMIVIKRLIPHWKIVIPLLVLVLAVVFYLNEMYGQILLYVYILLVAGAIWAYFTAPKD